MRPSAYMEAEEQVSGIDDIPKWKSLIMTMRLSVAQQLNDS